MRTCSTCKIPKEETEFNWKRKKEGIRQTFCRSCNKEYQKEHYKANRQTYIDKAYAWNHQSRRSMRVERDRIKDVPCKDCKVKYPPWVMHFDHLRDKLRNVSSVTTVRQLKSESAKCEVVCANCHAERTHQRRIDIEQSVALSSNG